MSILGEVRHRFWSEIDEQAGQRLEKRKDEEQKRRNREALDRHYREQEIRDCKNSLQDEVRDLNQMIVRIIIQENKHRCRYLGSYGERIETNYDVRRRLGEIKEKYPKAKFEWEIGTMCTEFSDCTSRAPYYYVVATWI